MPNLSPDQYKNAFENFHQFAWLFLVDAEILYAPQCDLSHYESREPGYSQATVQALDQFI